METRDYSGEAWYRTLQESETSYIITDDYLGFRKKPHFTIAVKRVFNGRYYVLRAALDPIKIYENILSSSEVEEADLSIVNSDGYYQIVTPHRGTLLEESSIIPPREPQTAIGRLRINGKNLFYAYSWLREADWSLIVQWNDKINPFFIRDIIKIFALSALVITVIFFIIFKRAKKVAIFQLEREQAQAQLIPRVEIGFCGGTGGGNRP